MKCNTNRKTVMAQLSPQTEVRIIELFSLGYSKSIIARECKVSLYSILLVCKKHNLPIRRPWSTIRKYTPRQLENYIKKLNKEMPQKFEKALKKVAQTCPDVIRPLRDYDDDYSNTDELPIKRRGKYKKHKKIKP